MKRGGGNITAVAFPLWPDIKNVQIFKQRRTFCGKIEVSKALSKPPNFESVRLGIDYRFQELDYD
jgi:hypothetical protein